MQAGTEELDELADDAVLAQHLGDGENKIGSGGAFAQASGEFHADDERDQNGDGLLSPAEVQRIFPLPLAKGKRLNIGFADLDTDRNGMASRQEFRAYCHKNGFGPIIVSLESASSDDLRLGADDEARAP